MRTAPARPFECTGVDIAGPFSVKRGNTRNPAFVKSYICLYVCMPTHAIHFENTKDLSTEAFILAFEKFINRRGILPHIYSDNGSNFVGAARVLGSPTHLPYDVNDFTTKTSDLQLKGVQWHFIPARSPHCGGIWEAGVRRMKDEMRKTLGNYTPTLAEFHHLLTTVEAVLNSRPLLPVYMDSEYGIEVITPRHFLIGRPIRAHPNDIPKQDKRVHLNLLRNEIERLWKRWHVSYIQSLQARSKWGRKQTNFKMGDVVLLKDDSLKQHNWPLARITNVQLGPDGLVRVVELALPEGQHFTRHIRHLVPLIKTSSELPRSPGKDVQDPEGFGGSDSPDEVTRATRKNDTSSLHL